MVTEMEGVPEAVPEALSEGFVVEVRLLAEIEVRHFYAVSVEIITLINT